MTDRSCAGTNARGEPCASPCVGPDGRCAAHRKGADMSALGRAGGHAAVKAKRERGRSIKELLHEQFEADRDSIYADLQECRKRGDWDGAVLVLGRAFGRTVDQTAEIEARREHLASYSDEPSDGLDEWRLV